MSGEEEEGDRKNSAKTSPRPSRENQTYSPWSGRLGRKSNREEPAAVIARPLGWEIFPSGLNSQFSPSRFRQWLREQTRTLLSHRVSGNTWAPWNPGVQDGGTSEYPVHTWEGQVTKRPRGWCNELWPYLKPYLYPTATWLFKATPSPSKVYFPVIIKRHFNGITAARRQVSLFKQRSRLTR